MEVNKKISIHGYKFNGWLYRAWEFPTIIEETDEYLCVSSQGAEVITADKKKHNVYHHSKIFIPTIWYFYKKKWFNIVVFVKNKQIEFYVNIASPYILEENTIKYIDLDLDFKIVGQELNFIRKLDANEFDNHKIRFNYPDNLINKINEAEQQIMEMFNNKSLKNLINHEILFGRPKNS